MRRLGAIIVAAALLCAANGCGTLANMKGREHLTFATGTDADWAPARPTLPFGGLANDVTFIKKSEYPIQVVAGLLDMPFSLAADVLTLPWATQQWLSHQWLSVPPPPNAENDPWRRFWLEMPPETRRPPDERDAKNR